MSGGGVVLELPRYVYFVDWRDDGKSVRIGESSEGTRRRIEDHERSGAKLLCVLPVQPGIESRIHESLASYRDPAFPKSTSHYRGRFVWDYMSALVEESLASNCTDDLPHIPVVSWSSLNPILLVEKHRSTERYELQTTIMDVDHGQWDPRPRLARAHKVAYLSSLSDEWYTPDFVVEAARRTMGGIDLDPASNHTAQRRIQAGAYYSQRVSGLREDRPWFGRVWLNPPYGDLGPEFVGRLIREWNNQTISCALALLSANAISSKWFTDIWTSMTALGVSEGRWDFVRGHESQKESSPSKGSVVVYFGHDLPSFQREFSPFATILVRAS